MSDLLQSGHHPDADQLNAFVEHALPEHEHQQTLAHLAICPDCRAIVTLSQPPVEEPTPEPIRKRRFFTWNLAWPTVAGLAAVVLLLIYTRHAPVENKNAVGVPDQVAASHPHAPLQGSNLPPNPKPPTAPSEKPQRAVRRPEAATNEATDTISAEANKPVDAKSLQALHGQSHSLDGLPKDAPTSGPTSVHGRLNPQIDTASGATMGAMKAPPNAAQRFEQPQASASAASATPSNRLREGPPVSSFTQQAMLPPPTPQPSTVPTAAPSAPTALGKTADLPATQQSVEVAAAPAPTLSTSNAEVTQPFIGNIAPRHPLPSNLPILSMVSNAHQILAIDTHNAVFFSKDDGATWNAIPAQWQGHAVKVSLATSGGTAAFVSHSRTANFGAIGGPVPAAPPSTTLPSGATLTGAITDQTGAVIPNASVVVGNGTTPNLRTVKTDRSGHYIAADLGPGNYQVEVEAPGFLKQHIDVVLTASQQTLANFTLTIGAATETVTVEASSEPVATLSVQKKRDTAPTKTRQSLPLFEVITDTGDRWISVDGTTWKHQ